MCLVCIASTDATVDGSTGGILAVCIGKFQKVFSSESSRSGSDKKGEFRWQQTK